MVAIRPYQPATDEPAVFDVWRATFASTWPLTREMFRRVTVGAAAYQDGDHVVAEERGIPIGFVATQVDPDGAPRRTGHIGILLVAPARRRQGIGRALHAAALAHLQERDVGRVQLGGGDAYLWPGVPSTLSPALSFFCSCGWSYAETSYDLVQDLRGYVSPLDVYRRVDGQRIVLEIGAHQHAAEVLTFVAREFPSWEAAYRSVVDLGDYADLLLARDDGHIIGTTIMYSPLSHPRRVDVRWKTLLGEDVGAISVVGVAASARRRGVGHALAARASEIVRERGAHHCFIGWTWMIGLYGELGYRVWHEYRMSRRELHSA